MNSDNRVKQAAEAVEAAAALEFEPCAAERMVPELAGTIDWLALSVPRPGRIHIEFAVA